jgi:hypothetical protein
METLMYIAAKTIDTKVAAGLVLDTALEDIDGLIAEVLQAQPMHPSKRGALLGRLQQVRSGLLTLQEALKTGALQET